MMIFAESSADMSWFIDFVRSTGPVGTALVVLTGCIWFLFRSACKMILPVLQAATPITNNVRQITDSLEISTKTAGEVQEKAERLIDKLSRLREEERPHRAKGLLDT